MTVPIIVNESLIRRFREKHTPVPESGCWLWTASINQLGYGQIAHNHRAVSAHRASYSIHIGPIPDGLCVLHKCDVRCCVNPDHLFLGTQLENIQDRWAKGRTSTYPHGESVNTAKLTPEQVLAIRAECGTLAEIGKRYGVGRTAIGRIKSGKTWKHLT